MKTERPGGELEKVIRRIAFALYFDDAGIFARDPNDKFLIEAGYWNRARVAYHEIIKIDEERAA